MGVPGKKNSKLSYRWSRTMKSEEDIVSIVIPVYNCEEYLTECLESVIKQTYELLDIIIVNDGSTDRSGEICIRYASLDDRIRYIEKENGGLSSARRKGISLVKGKFFCTIDGDDYLDEQYIEKLYLEISKYGADVALCGWMSFDQNNEIIEYPLAENLPGCMRINKRQISKNYAGLAIQYQMSDSWNKMYRTDFVRQSGIKHELDRKYNGTDLLFNHLLLLHIPKIATVKQVLYHYRIVKGSIVHRKNKPLQEGFECITRRLIDECRKLEYAEDIERQVILSYYGMLKYATLEIANENRGKQLKIKLKESVDRHRKYIAVIKCDIGLKEILLVDKHSLRLFFIFLRIGSCGGVIGYYMLRDKTRG